ncbi:hypothetical protein BpHYR1_000085 [Brachionus plicatilis]|uniref:Uncharacterized protein n=1 Tax=Brachionus plicatilis TaxID=10195 RepID=A0A3M7SP69_BRAPC|nr:hypothetical protein BpHYR1_000085 [Brachionus plicatilis]
MIGMILRTEFQLLKNNSATHTRKMKSLIIVYIEYSRFCVILVSIKENKTLIEFSCLGLKGNYY